VNGYVSVVFEKTPLDCDPDCRFEYWSAKRTAMVENTQAVVLSKGDMHWLSQRDCIANEKLWKIYWWGGHHDEALIRRLDAYIRLGRIGDPALGTKVTCRQGFTESIRDKKPSPKWFRKYRELPADNLVSYGPFDENWLVPVPKAVKRTGSKIVYRGTRLLIGRGVGGSQITARLETLPFCFRNSINALRLEGFQAWQEETLLGICWSSLTKYYFFMTLGSWLWHDEVHRENAVELPICFPTEARLRDRIVQVVEGLRNLDLCPGGLTLAGLDAQRRLPRLERELDDAIFDLYELSESERNLVRDMCSVGLDLFYRNYASDAAKPVVLPPRLWGTCKDVALIQSGLGAYVRTFLQVWNTELEPDGELAWRVLSPPSGAPLLAVSFATRFKKEPVTAPSDADTEAWANVLEKLKKDTRVPVGSSAVFIDTFFRVIGEREMLFIKRNETRFWTRTAAREDAEAAMVVLMQKEQAQGVEGK
jgi:hypothetical protein